MEQWHVFISYKHTDKDGRDTKDYKLAREFYDYLRSKGLQVFLSSVELKNMGQAKYAKGIDDALESSAHLVAVGCSKEHFESGYVDYEWRSFHTEIIKKQKPNSKIFLLYKDMKDTELPYALRQYQAFDASEKDSFEELYEYIINALGQAAPTPPPPEPTRIPWKWILIGMLAAALVIAGLLLRPILPWPPEPTTTTQQEITTEEPTTTERPTTTTTSPTTTTTSWIWQFFDTTTTTKPAVTALRVEDLSVTVKFDVGTCNGLYTGYVVNGKPEGQGDFTSSFSFAMCTSYSGEWENGLPNGEGTAFYTYNAQDHKYVGNWKDGKKHGSGTSTHVSDGTVCYKGQWKDGKSVN